MLFMYWHSNQFTCALNSPKHGILLLLLCSFLNFFPLKGDFTLGEIMENVCVVC